MTDGRFFIVLYCNKKKLKILYRCYKFSTITQYWHEFKTQKPPPFVKLQGGKRKRKLIYELALIFPKNKKAGKTYVKDELGRNIEIKLDSKKFRIKEIIPYWREETIFDFDTKKRIRYHEIINIILDVSDIAQVFTLNNKVFLQVENDIRMFGNRNIEDANRLFETIRNDITKKGRGNFIFVKDISTYQRSQLYDLLTSKGYKRTELFRHYSY